MSHYTIHVTRVSITCSLRCQKYKVTRHLLISPRRKTQRLYNSSSYDADHENSHVPSRLVSLICIVCLPRQKAQRNSAMKVHRPDDTVAISILPLPRSSTGGFLFARNLPRRITLGATAIDVSPTSLTSLHDHDTTPPPCPPPDPSSPQGAEAKT